MCRMGSVKRIVQTSVWTASELGAAGFGRISVGSRFARARENGQMIAAARTARAPHVSHSAAGPMANNLMPICGAQTKAADHVSEYTPM